MTRIYFFYKRNARTGEVLEDQIIDADANTASLYVRQQQHFKFIGWSDGRFLREANLLGGRPMRRDKNSLPLKTTAALRKEIMAARDKEVEFAKENPDKRIPDTSAVGINKEPISDPYLAAALKNRQRG